MLALTVVMIAGFVALIATLIVRLPADPQVLPESVAESVALPDGAAAVAFTQAADWFAIVTDDDRILIYDRASGALRQTVTLD